MDTHLSKTKPAEQMTEKELREELEYLRAENAVLKKLKALAQQAEQIKSVNLKAKHPLQWLLKATGLARSVYYYHRTSVQRPDPDQNLKQKIYDIFHIHKGRYEYRRIIYALKNDGIQVNHKRVQRLMIEQGLKSKVRPKRYQSYRGRVGKVAPNRPERKFYTEKPNQKWVTDVTEFKVDNQKVYLSPEIDLFNQEVVSMK